MFLIPKSNDYLKILIKFPIWGQFYVILNDLVVFFLLELPVLFSGVNSHKDIFSCTAAVLGTSLTPRVNETLSNYL